MNTAWGQATVDLVSTVFDRGTRHAVLLMRHSAREYAPDRHDLHNPLTDRGREWARRFGGALPRHLTLRGYASPPQRCMETAELVLSGHQERGGVITRHRPLEALGIFYVLDQMKMWRGLHAAGGLLPYLEAWFQGEIPPDTLMQPDAASRALLGVLAEKLNASLADAQLDVCVSHDMTLYLMRSRLLGESLSGPAVAYLDGLILFREAGDLKLRGLSGCEVSVSAAADQP